MLRAVSTGVASQNAVAKALFQLLGANMQSAADQAMTQLFSGSIWVPTLITFTWASGAFNTACAGGIYTAAAKGGTAIVAAGQSYAALTGANTALAAAIAAAGPFANTVPILSLTTANGAALTANVVIWGNVLQ
jgi:hypothetical protein